MINLQRLPYIFAAVVLMTGCAGQNDPWFDRDLESALAAADERGTLVMVDFKTSWCTWCKRLEEDTFSDAIVQAEMRELVALKLDAEGEGQEAAERYGVQSYPTIVFLDGKGREIDRILGYLPPDAFLEEVRRIRAGDTFAACLESFEEDPSSFEALERAVEGLLERSDSYGAVERIETHQTVHGTHGDEGGHGGCEKLMFRARSELHSQYYRRAARLYRRDWPEIPTVPDTEGVGNLRTLVAELGAVEDQAEALREARKSDAALLLSHVRTDDVDTADLRRIADFAFQSGQFDLARQFYLGWAEGREPGDGIEALNGVAWNLYLMDVEIAAATDLAREAYASDSSPNVADTLARLLYVGGAAEEAVELQREAADGAEGSMAEALREAVVAMEAGEDLADEPAFLSFPGAKLSS